jgi:dCTP deaminase
MEELVMILTGPEILEAVQKGDIVFSPLRESQVNPNSIDVHLDAELISYVDEVIDPAVENATNRVVMPDAGYLLNAHNFILGSSIEIVGSTKYVPIIHGKSGIARAGLFIHISAGLVDLGSIGNLTFQMAA